MRWLITVECSRRRHIFLDATDGGASMRLQIVCYAWAHFSSNLVDDVRSAISAPKQQMAERIHHSSSLYGRWHDGQLKMHHGSISRNSCSLYVYTTDRWECAATARVSVFSVRREELPHFNGTHDGRCRSGQFAINCSSIFHGPIRC